MHKKKEGSLLPEFQFLVFHSVIPTSFSFRSLQWLLVRKTIFYEYFLSKWVDRSIKTCALILGSKDLIEIYTFLNPDLLCSPSWIWTLENPPVSAFASQCWDYRHMPPPRCNFLFFPCVESCVMLDPGDSWCTLQTNKGNAWCWPHARHEMEDSLPTTGAFHPLPDLVWRGSLCKNA